MTLILPSDSSQDGLKSQYLGMRKSRLQEVEWHTHGPLLISGRILIKTQVRLRMRLQSPPEGTTGSATSLGDGVELPGCVQMHGRHAEGPLL